MLFIMIFLDFNHARTHPRTRVLSPIYIYINVIITYIYMTTEMKVQVVTSFTIKQYVSKYVFK